jgi:hypothetical protein
LGLSLVIVAGLPPLFCGSCPGTEPATGRVEEYNFGIRKHLIEYDDVVNRQREVIYDRRLQALTGE